MPWCVRCGMYGPSAELRRLPKRSWAEPHLWACKNKTLCRSRLESGAVTDAKHGKAATQTHVAKTRA